jgi:parallel beta-helix repeat protein
MSKRHQEDDESMILLMRRKEISEIVLLLILTGFLTPALNIKLAWAEPRTWIVDDDEPADFHTIQEAVNAANSSDTIFVKNGTYYEHVVVNKALSLVGENRSNTIIDGNGTGNVLRVSASYVGICGFTIQKSGSAGSLEAGIFLNGARFCNVTHNNLVGNCYGISLTSSSNNSIYENNITNNNVGGIDFAFSNNNTICKNDITRNIYGTAIRFTGSDNNQIFQNNIENNGYGIILGSSDNNIVAENNITKNHADGVSLSIAWYNIISGNNITANQACIYIEYSRYDNISKNNIANGNVGIYFHHGDGHAFYHNNFVNNKDQIYFLDICVNNTWDDGYPSGGNYWSDYTGIDNYSGPYQNETGSDGIGDTPYIVEGNNIDHYPLMNPYTPHNIAITNVVPSKNVVGQGYCTSINITIANQGNTPETITVTTYANTTTLQTNILALENNASTTITLTWNTTGFAYGYYTIWAYALPVLGELNKTDNTLMDGTVLVTVPGDVSGDCLCDMLDISILADKFLTQPPNPLYDPNCDINNDGIIDMADISIAIDHFLQEFTP